MVLIVVPVVVLAVVPVVVVADVVLAGVVEEVVAPVEQTCRGIAKHENNIRLECSGTELKTCPT